MNDAKKAKTRHWAIMVGTTVLQVLALTIAFYFAIYWITATAGCVFAFCIDQQNRSIIRFRRSLCFVVLAAMWLGQPSTTHAQTPPDDSQKYHVVTVINDPPTAADVALLRAFQTQPHLATIAQKCKRFQFKATDPLYRSRYAQSLPPHALPVVALVRHDGGVIYKASGAAIPEPNTLARQLIGIAMTDREAHAPRLGWRPDGSRFPSVIPDTVVVRPEVNLPSNAVYNTGFVVGGVILFLALGGLFVVGLIAGIFLLFRGD
ncbi:hypothetical protein [Novipirellula caenicola]|uniref:DUF4174 domain-containing protein n=1 Tax=Novipirellula caenicola TaxID=1536901 RepID=A0ABP9W0P1_9BACT